MVAISDGKGVLMCERYKKMNAEYFAWFIDWHFDTMFAQAGKGLTRFRLQVGDPSQNSKMTHDTMAHCHAKLLRIPPRFPDFKAIENIFNIVYKKLAREVPDGKIDSISNGFC